jgi:RHH-type transcriptional regulator, proline utilization regulon repressor / proline dehydrogenase / delta 1-pyrroline-5-carboxylate dehydrogenase
MTTWSAEAIEARTQQLGRALLDAARDYRPGAAERVEDWLLTRAVADNRFRSRLLRYMDVLAALDYDESGHEAKRLAREYFGDEFPDLPFTLRWLLRIARDEHLPAPLVGESARRSAELFARRFITPPGADTVERTTEELVRLGRHPSFDLLGEAVLSDAEAQSYVERYLRLIAQLDASPHAGQRTSSGVLALQISLKLSSLTAHFTPIDPYGTLARVRTPLEAIAGAAEVAGIGLTIDMEQYAYRDLTWDVFRSVFARGARFGAWPDAGIVLQSYLRVALPHARDVAAFARERGTPFQVRLVKGAYWDYETIVADANRWSPPVWTEKSATDASYERTLNALLDAHPYLHVAVASHNARAHAYAEAAAEGRDLPAGTIEHQTLYRTAEGTSRALAALGWQARDYVPVGELLPGMAYLVRRVLENSSQAGFLLRSRSGADPEELLRPPPEAAAFTGAGTPPVLSPSKGDRVGTPFMRMHRDDFGRMPEARWFDPDFRGAFESALASTRAQWDRYYDLQIAAPAPAPLKPALSVPASRALVEGGEGEGGGLARAEIASEWTAIHSPSYPYGDPVGHVPLAGADTAQQAASYVREHLPRWSATSVDERAAILRRAADVLEARAHEFAAWIVHEGGRDRDGAYAEVVEAVDYLRYYAAQAYALFTDFDGLIAPRGVVAVIPPWNFSLAIPCGMTSAALACGNGVVLKPAGQTPIIAHHLVELLHEAGVPRAALAWLPGRGSTAGQALVDSTDVAMVAFTGSRTVGTRMHADVSRVEVRDGALKALVAEMGGKNPVLVFADADLDEAVDGIMRSAFGHANQKCSAASRVLVASAIFVRLRDRLVEAARSVHVGSADAPATQVNPIIDRAAWERLQEAAATARQECDVLLDRFAGTPGTLECGPLIVTCSADRALESRTFNDELFGPILLLVPFDDEAEAIRLANATEYGLTAGLFSRSPRTIDRVTRALESGTVYVNRVTTGARVGIEPFGGMRMSGTGPKAGGPDYLWAYVRRTEVPPDDPADLEVLAATASHEPEGSRVQPAPDPQPPLVPSAPNDAPSSEMPSMLPADLSDRWDAPLTQRLEAVERAAVLLGQRGHPDTALLLNAAQQARRELGAIVPIDQVAGQHTELWYDVARGRALMRATSKSAASWLAAALLGGNSVALFDGEPLASTVEALRAAGVPQTALGVASGGITALLAAAESPTVAFAAVDGGAAVARALYDRLGPTTEGQRALKSLLSPLDGPQPGEPGFMQRFAWPRVIAIRTLRHGADLALEAPTGSGL